MQKFKSIAGIFVAIFLVTGGMSAVHGQQSKTGSTKQSSVSSKDKKFVDKALRGGMLEVALGKEAARKTTNSEVKTFADRLVQDHTKANQQLTQIAQKEGLQVPNEMGSKMEKKLKSFAKLHGTDFDRKFLSLEVKDHKDDIKDFNNEAKGGSNPGIKDFASQTVPQLQEHLSMAQSLDQKLGKSKK